MKIAVRNHRLPSKLHLGDNDGSEIIVDYRVPVLARAALRGDDRHLSQPRTSR